MPDDSVMVAFTQATGPVKNRPRTDQRVLAMLDWPPGARAGEGGQAGYDMNGSEMSTVYLRLTEGGSKCEKVAENPLRSCMNGVVHAHAALPDGSIVRAVWGQYLPFDDGPKTGYLQRSKDGAKSWGPPEVLLDQKTFTTWPTRLRQLRDGRWIVSGGLSHAPSDTTTRTQHFVRGVSEPLLMISEDGKREKWSPPIRAIPDELRANWSGEECDFAELSNGDLLGVFRTLDPTQGSDQEVYWQGLLRKNGASWTPIAEEFKPVPFKVHGHPNLLSTAEGAVLHFAPEGVQATADGGRTWRAVQMADDGKSPLAGVRYYPTAVQARDGNVFVFSHVGADDPFDGSVDQSVSMTRFKPIVK